MREVNLWEWGKILLRIKACLHDKKQRSSEQLEERGRDSGQGQLCYSGHTAIASCATITSEAFPF